jgi:hypothetical protein
MNLKIKSMDLQELREEIYTDFIQEYNHLTQDEISDLVDMEIEKYKLNTKYRR